MSEAGLSPAARRLHGLAIGLLVLQLILAAAAQPLIWGGVLLVVMAALKLAESRRAEDLQRAGLAELVTLGLLAVLSPELGTSLLQALTALVVLAALLCQEAGGRRSLLQALVRSLQLGLAALPLLALLFLLLPRLGPLWSVPGQSTSRSGLSDQLNTGTISRLVQDPAPALRISYLEGGPPAMPQRYWRVLVLDRFDGRSWRASPQPTPPRQRRQAGHWITPQQIWVAEPAAVAALPWPGHGLPSDAALTITANGELLDGGEGGTRRRYGLSNLSDRPSAWQLRPPQPIDQSYNPGRNPRLEAIAESWRQQLPPAERIEAARELLTSLPLRYTLAPPTLPERAPLDALLFQTQAGFCEHFASSFTALMRAAGVPARVVIGYQGGEWVPGDGWGSGYLEVRQRDAHAWSEVWLEGEGWRQVDPTAWLAPARIQGGVLAGLGQQPSDLARLAQQPQWWRVLERSWTRLDLAWSRWVLSFDADSQSRVLGRWRDWQGVLLMGGLILLMAPTVWLLQHQPVRLGLDRQRRELDRCLAGLRRLGLTPQPGESLQQFTDRTGRARPELIPALSLLAERYGELRFAGGRRSRDISRALRQAEQELTQQLRRLPRRPVERADLPQR